jgi:branched-chain amino acid transport system permease protein
MNQLLEIIINSLSLGGTYALLALGLAIVFGILQLINFAHGELIAITGYGMFFLSMIGLPWALIIIFAIAITVVAILLLERIAYRPVRNAPPTSGFMTSFAVMMLLQVAWTNFISPRRRSVVLPEFLSGTTAFGGITIGNIQIVAILITTISLIALGLFLKRTNLGIAMRAAATDFQVTRLMGIRANRVVASAFAISGFLAAIAGVVWIAQRASIEPTIGLAPTIKAFIAVVFGGLTSLTGAAMGGLVLGFVEIILRTLLPADIVPYREALELTVVILILIHWPGGLISIFYRKEKNRMS